VGNDTVLFATGFPDPGSFAQSFSTTGSVTVDPNTNKGQVTIFAGASVTMVVAFTLGTTQAFAPDTLKFTTSATGSLIIDSIEIFGSQ
jgi:hypothetical protein